MEYVFIDNKNGDEFTREDDKIYTHDEAASIVDLFESVLSRYGIHVPSPEDDERDDDNMVGLYGSEYSDLLEAVEDALIELLEHHKPSTKVVPYVFS